MAAGKSTRSGSRRIAWSRWRWEQQDEWSEVGEDEQEKTDPQQEHGEAVRDDTKPCQAQAEEKQSEGSEPCLQKPEQMEQKKSEWWEWEKPRKEWEKPRREWEKPRTPTSTPHLQQQEWQKPKSGWMNRLITLLAALKRGDEVRVKYLTKKFSEHWAVESLVTRHIECINRWGGIQPMTFRHGWWARDCFQQTVMFDTHSTLQMSPPPMLVICIELYRP